jgi:hypothetical protein
LTIDNPAEQNEPCVAHLATIAEIVSDVSEVGPDCVEVQTVEYGLIEDDRNAGAGEEVHPVVGRNRATEVAGRIHTGVDASTACKQLAAQG